MVYDLLTAIVTILFAAFLLRCYDFGWSWLNALLYSADCSVAGQSASMIAS